MSDNKSPATRFREFRERAGLSHDEMAIGCEISSSCIWDIEAHDDELSSCYSPKQVLQLCEKLGIRPIELFGFASSGSPVTATDLVRLIHEQCRLRGLTLEQFEDVVGWRLQDCIEPPERLLEDMTVDGLQWLCRELGIDWLRVIVSLQ